MKKRVIILCLFFSCWLFPQESFSETTLPNEPGTYPVKTSYVEDGKELQKIIYVTVKSEDTVIVGDVAIDAKDFLMTVDQAKRLTAKQAINYSEAKAWSTIDGSEKVITTVDLSSIRPETGVYQAAFSTNEGVTKIVNVTVDEPLLGNRELNNYQNKFVSSSWRFLLTLGFLLVLILLTPLVIVLFSSRNIVQVINELIEIFSK
ncbi:MULTISPECIES: hypothetical protein [Enterococcus]|uniref:Uncharacterized protein n=1 Tax=Candidatus Enterococcus murrayae TaxID=2815321 RepID=A0ABS3HKU1_9ENTE|nr:hypothetical protein [Enterococcus sp. MJM16]MBO0453198.1 hypothetical protein [Enterococcus sp. MJM16]